MNKKIFSDEYLKTNLKNFSPHLRKKLEKRKKNKTKMIIKEKFFDKNLCNKNENFKVQNVPLNTIQKTKER